MYLDMLELFLIPQLQQVNMSMAIFWQDGALPHWSVEVHAFLENTFINVWCHIAHCLACKFTSHYGAQFLSVRICNAHFVCASAGEYC
jgi:hypothetical protein